MDNDKGDLGVVIEGLISLQNSKERKVLSVNSSLISGYCDKCDSIADLLTEVYIITSEMKEND